MWICPVCETRNEDTRKTCRVCQSRSPHLPSDDVIRKERKRFLVRIALIGIFGAILILLLLGLLFGMVLPEFGERQHDQEVAKRVTEMIDGLSVESIQDRDTVEDARELYDGLSEEQKQFVENYEDLEKAEETLESLNTEPVYYVNRDGLTGSGVYLRKEASGDAVSTGIVSRGDHTKLLLDLKNDAKDDSGTTWHFVRILQTGGEASAEGYVRDSEVQYATEAEIAAVLGETEEAGE